MSSLTSLKTSNEETTMAPDAAVSEYKVAYNYSSRQDFVKEVRNSKLLVLCLRDAASLIILKVPLK